MFCSKEVFFTKTSSFFFCPAVLLIVRRCCCKQFICRWFVPPVLRWMNDFCCTTIIMGGCWGQWRAAGGGACLGLYCCVSCIQHKCHNTRQKCFSTMECDKRDSCATTSSGSFKYLSHSLSEWRGGVWMTIQSVPANAPKFSFVRVTVFKMIKKHRHVLHFHARKSSLNIGGQAKMAAMASEDVNLTISYLTSLGAIKRISLFSVCASTLVNVHH